MKVWKEEPNKQQEPLTPNPGDLCSAKFTGGIADVIVEDGEALRSIITFLQPGQ